MTIAKAEKELQKAYETLAMYLTLSIEARDPHTKGHSERVKLYCRKIARKMNLSSKKIQALERAASLHDIGKIAIPDAILYKQGRLTPSEFVQLQAHPDRSFELIRLIPNPQDTLLAIRYHHERVDGKGYPLGLAGDRIPLLARILAVADSYDALNSDRPYRKAFTHDEATQILRNNSGTQWDPDVVEAAIEALSINK